MDKDKKISVTSGLTINTGNYESERIDFTYQRNLEKNEDKETALLNEYNFVRGIIKDIEPKIKPKTKQRRRIHND